VANKSAWKTWTAKLAALATAAYAIIPVAPAAAAETLGYKEIGGALEAGIGLDTNGKVWGWGDYPKIGSDWNYTLHKPMPIRTADGQQLDNIADIANGIDFALALEDNGALDTVWAWGVNDYGQLGNGSYSDSIIPVQVQLPAGDVRKIAAGEQFGLALVGGIVYAWGLNTDGQAGSSSDSAVITPAPIRTLDGLLLEGVVDIAAGNNFAYAVVEQLNEDTNATERIAYAWGDPEWSGGSYGYPYQAAPLSALGTDVDRVFAGWAGEHSFATVGGAVYGWGNNSREQIRPGAAPNITTPALIEGLDGYSTSTIVPGWTHTLLISNGSVYGMGANGNNQLGFADPSEDISQPTPLVDGHGTPLAGAVSVFAGEYNGGAVFGPGSSFGAGGALAWGRNTNGQLGVGSEYVFTTVSTPKQVLAPAYSGRSISFSLIDPERATVNKCGETYLASPIGGMDPMKLPDGTCLFPDVELGDTPTIEYYSYDARYHGQNIRLGPITEDVNLGAIALTPSYIASFVSFEDDHPTAGRIQGYLSWQMNNWPGTHEMKSRVYFVKTDGSEAGTIAENLESNAFALGDTEIPEGAVGIQIETTNTLAPDQSYEMPKPYYFLDAPTHLPKVAVRDIDPRAYGYDNEYIGLKPEIAIEAPADLRYDAYDVRFYMAGEGYYFKPVGVFEAVANETLVINEELQELSFTSRNNFFYIDLLDEDGNAVYESFSMAGIEFDYIAAEQVAFTASDLTTPNVSFADEDETEGEVGGVVSWSWTDEAAPGSFTGYVLYFVDESGFKVEPIAKSRSYGPTSYELPMNTVVPEGAAGIGVFPYYIDGGVSHEPASTAYYAPAEGASEGPGEPAFSVWKLTFIDQNAQPNQIAGLLRWEQGADESWFDEYAVLNESRTEIGTVAKGMTGPYYEFELPPAGRDGGSTYWIAPKKNGTVVLTSSLPEIAVYDETSGASVGTPGTNGDLLPTVYASYSGQITGRTLTGGSVAWSSVLNEAAAGYQLYFMGANGKRVSSIAYVPKRGPTLTSAYPLHIPKYVPDEAYYIGIFTVGHDGRESAAHYQLNLGLTPIPGGGYGHPPLRPTFFDHDDDALQIGGQLYVPNYGGAGTVSGYQVLIAQPDGTPIVGPVATAPAEAATIDVPYDTVIPDGRARIILRVLLTEGGHTDLSAQIWDSPLFRPEDMDFLDDHKARGTVAGRLEWAKPEKESLFDAYLIDTDKPAEVTYPSIPNVPVDPSKQRYSVAVPSFSSDQIEYFRLSEATDGGEQSNTWHIVSIADNTTEEPYLNTAQSSAIPGPANVKGYFYPSEDSVIDGWMEWEHPADRSALHGYQLYFLDAAGQRVGSYVFIKYWAPEPGEYERSMEYFELPPHIPFPASAASIAVHAVDNEYTESADKGVVPLSRLNVSFYDADHGANVIGGAVNWHVSWEPASVTGYEIFYGDAAGQPIGQPIGTVSATAPRPYAMTIPANTTPPQGAETFVVRMASASGTVAQAHAVIWDRPTEFPRWEHAVDADASAGVVRPVIRWVGATDETDIDAYLIEARAGINQYPIEIAKVDVQTNSSYYQYEVPAELAANVSQFRVVPLTAGGESPGANFIPLYDDISASAMPAVTVDAGLPKPELAWLEKAEAADYAQGRVSWRTVAGTATVTGYRAYFLDQNGAKLRPLAYVKHDAVTTTYMLPLAKELAIPAEAAAIGIFAAGGGAESAQFASVSLALLRDPPKVRQLHWVDIDTDLNRVRGAVTWLPPADATGVQKYELYYGDAQGVPYGAPIASVAPGGPLAVHIPAGTVLQPQQKTIVVATIASGGIAYAVVPLTDVASRDELGRKLQTVLRPTEADKVQMNNIRKYIQSGRLTNLVGEEGIGRDDIELLLDLIEPRFMSGAGTN